MLKPLEKMGNYGKQSQIWRKSYEIIPPKAGPHPENKFHHRGHDQLAEDDGAILLPALVAAEILAATGHHAGLAGAHGETWANLSEW